MNILRRMRRAGASPKPERTHYGMKLILPDTMSEKELLSWLAALPKDAYKLPADRGIAFDFGRRFCSRNLILHILQSVVWEKGLNVIAWLSADPASIELLRSAGLSVSVRESEPERNGQTAFSESESEAGGARGSVVVPEPQRGAQKGGGPYALIRQKIVYASMRSGQRIDTEGDVLVWGHMNAGAEITAGGSVIVAGRLLGVVHAGAFGREDVFVWAGSFETPQVRLGHKLCYADPKTTKCWKKGVLITLEDSEPVIREHKFFATDKNDRRA